MITDFAKFSTGDTIQVGMLAIAAAAIVFAGWQVHLQTRVLRAQLLKDRFEMYWRNYEPVSDDLVEDLKLYPKDWMPEELYARDYKDNQRSIRRYIVRSRTYEYLAFLHVLHRELKIEDQLGQAWSDRWAAELISDSKEFRDAHASYGEYYPGFSAHVEGLRRGDV